MHARPVLVRRVDEPVLALQPHRKPFRPLQVAAPPVARKLLPGHVLLHSLDDDQPVGGDRVDRVAAPLGRQPEVGPGVVGAPAGRAVRLVLDVGTDHVGRLAVSPGHQPPAVEPVLLAEGFVVPEFRDLRVVEAVAIEQHEQPEPASLGHDPVEHLERRQPLESRVGALGEVDSRDVRRADGVHREGHADQIEPDAPDLGERFRIVAGPDPVRHVGLGLHPEPADAAENDGPPRAIDDLGTAGRERGPNLVGGGRHHDRDQGRDHRRCRMRSRSLHRRASVPCPRFGRPDCRSGPRGRPAAPR